EKGEIDKSLSGVWAILTGGGKTTKDIGCLVRGGKNNVILCVIHGVAHGGYEVVKDDLIYYEDRSGSTPVKKGKFGLSILQAEKLLGYIARSAVKPAELKEPTQRKMEELRKSGQVNENFAENIAEMKKKVISKEDTIIVFDEAHFNDAKYQELQKKLVKANYK
ncbi:241_t:CDS:2, partial [Cetraspora pellucida]